MRTIGLLLSMVGLLIPLISLTFPAAQGAAQTFSHSYTVPDYSPTNSTPDSRKTIQLSIATEMETVWVQGNRYDVLVTLNAVKGANVTDFVMNLMVVKAYRLDGTSWVFVNGDPEVVGTNASSAQVRATIYASSQTAGEGWAAVEIDLVVKYSDGSGYSLSPWRSGRDFGPIQYQTNPFVYLQPSNTLPYIIAPLAIVAIVGFLWYRRRRAGPKKRR